MYLSAGKSFANKLNNLNRTSASRFFLGVNNICSKASAISDTNAKVIYSLAPAMDFGMSKDGNYRIPFILGALEKAKLTPEWRETEISQVLNIRSATMEDITSVHSKSYLDSLKKAVERAEASENSDSEIEDSDKCNTTTSAEPANASEHSDSEVDYAELTKFSDHSDSEIEEDSGPTFITATTYKEALVAVGAGLSLVDSVVAASKCNGNPPVGFALIRPPGHHAAPDGTMGSCIFNNVAIAARYAQRAHGLQRVFIIDFDLYHGNGTNDTFYDDPDVLFLSTHLEAGYPRHTGKFDDIGCGNGEGTTINVPLPAGSDDIAMQTVFDEVIVPSAQRFKPDIILVSAGYNGHKLEIMDPWLKKNFLLTTGTYYMLASSIKQLAKDLCGGQCVFFLEGGTNENVLPFSIAESFRGFIGEPSMAPDFEQVFASPFVVSQTVDGPSCEEIKQAIERVKRLHSL